MKRYAFLVLIAAAGCSPHYTSGKTECSSSKQCPSGYSCKDDGTSATHYCFDNKTLNCPEGSGFYCSQSQTCFPLPGACSTVTFCGTAKHPNNVICGSPNYHADCNADQCVLNSAIPDAGPGLGGMIGTGGATTGKGGAGGVTVIGYGGATGTGGVTVIGYGGTGGNKDAGPDVIGGSIGTGGIRDAGPDGSGGVTGSGGLYLTGGITGRGGSGGIIGTGGTTATSTLCSGTPYTCTSQIYAGDCATENGCTWTSSASICSGACSHRLSQSDCTAMSGCTWSTSTSTCSGTPASCCTGTPSACTSYPTSTWCIYNGCDWAGTRTCNATPTTTYCSGLTTTDACDTCEYNTCCGQFTACINDTNCSTNYTGTLWNAWVDCYINCCGTACGW